MGLAQGQLSYSYAHALFAEIETLAEESERSAASAAILSLVAQFELPPPQRKSYLALLLAKVGQNR
jgi:hypothetical protein